MPVLGNQKEATLWDTAAPSFLLLGYGHGHSFHFDLDLPAPPKQLSGLAQELVRALSLLSVLLAGGCCVLGAADLIMWV